jgi:hypothetical protein
MNANAPFFFNLTRMPPFLLFYAYKIFGPYYDVMCFGFFFLYVNPHLPGFVLANP